MGTVRTEFLDRVAEVDAYFSFVQVLVGDANGGDPGLRRLLVSSGAIRRGQVDDFRKMLRSGALLVLYNLMEATVNLSVDAIVEAIRRDRPVLHGVPHRIQQMVVREGVTRLIRDGANERKVEGEVIGLLGDLALGRTFKPPKGRGFSGNVNAERLRRHGNQLGFEFGKDPALQGGTLLEEVRKARNELGHGISRFSEVGRNYSVPDLMRIRQQTVAFLASYVEAVERYTRERAFRSDVILLTIPGLGPKSLQRLIAAFGSATTALYASESALVSQAAIGKSVAKAIVQAGRRTSLLDPDSD